MLLNFMPRQEVLRVMTICSAFYRHGVPILARSCMLDRLQRYEQFCAFVDFIFKEEGRPLLIQELSLPTTRLLYYRADRDEATKKMISDLTRLINDAHNLSSLRCDCVNEVTYDQHAMQLCTAISSCRSLRKIDFSPIVREGSKLLENITSPITDVTLCFASSTDCQALDMIAPFRRNLEKLELSLVPEWTMFKSQDTRFFRVRWLTIHTQIPDSPNHIRELAFAFPNLDVLKWHCLGDFPSYNAKDVRTAGTFCADPEDDEWESLDVLHCSVLWTYMFAFRCRVRFWRGAVCNVEEKELVHAVLRDIRPKHVELFVQSGSGSARWLSKAFQDTEVTHLNLFLHGMSRLRLFLARDLVCCLVQFITGFTDNTCQEELSTSFTNVPLEFLHLHCHAEQANLNYLFDPQGVHSKPIDLEALVSACAERLPSLSQVCFTFGHSHPYEACFSIAHSEGLPAIIRRTPKDTTRMAVARRVFRGGLSR